MVAEVVILMSNHEEKASIMKQLQAKIKRLMKKRWTMPALYLSLAAITLTTFIWLANADENRETADNNQDSQFDINDDGLEDTMANDNEDALPVTAMNEVFQMPVVDESEVAVVGTFFDYESSTADQVDSLIRYNNYYYQNKGIDLASKDGESFDVTAVMSGTVVKSEEDALFGQVVHIEHDKDVVTIYQSLGNTSVELGQTVKQGDVIAKASKNLYNSEAGVHLHFELRKNGVPVNPLDYMEQALTALPKVDSKLAAERTGADEQSNAEEMKEQAQTDKTIEDMQ